jgi:hypothetical protein
MQQYAADWNHARKLDMYYSQPISEMRSLFWQLFRVHSGSKNMAHQWFKLNVSNITPLVLNVVLVLNILAAV